MCVAALQFFFQLALRRGKCVTQQHVDIVSFVACHDDFPARKRNVHSDRKYARVLLVAMRFGYHNVTTGQPRKSFLQLGRFFADTRIQRIGMWQVLQSDF